MTGLFDNVFSRMAERKGFFREYGIDIEYTEITQGPVIQSALINGEVDLAELGTTLVTVPIERGVPLKIVGVPKPRQNLLFYSRQDINSVTDLYGRSIGTGAPGAPVYVAVQALFDKYDADLTQAELINLGSSSAVGQGLLAGKIDAGPAGIELLPEIQGASDLKVLYNLAEEIPDFIRVVIGATDQTMREKPNFVAAFLTAYSKGMRYAIEHREEGIELAKELFPSNAANIESSFDWYVQNQVINPNLDFSTESFERFQQLMLKLGLQNQPLRYEQVVNMSAQQQMLAQLGPFTFPR